MNERIENDFSFHPAKPEGGTAYNHDRVRFILKGVAIDLTAYVPAGREQSLMLTKLEEAMFWANAGIARNSDGE